MDHMKKKGYWYCLTRGILSDQGFASAFSNIVHTWGLHLKGPLYISIFRPLSIAIAAAIGVIFLGDALYLGRYGTLL